MINRFNKMAALLVAATTIASLGTAANAAQRLSTLDGTIDKAIVFDGGKYVYDGYMTDDDESGLYFNNGSKDTFLEDEEDYELVDGNVKYGTKYAVVENNGDEYLLDLSTGKILDDECLEDKKENLEYKMKSTFNKVDRYEKLKSVDLTQILEGQFGDVWYSYKVQGTDTITTTGESTTTPAVPAKKEGTILSTDFDKEIKIAGQVFDGTSLAYSQDTLIAAIEAASSSFVSEGFEVTAVKTDSDSNVKVTVVKTGEKAHEAIDGDFGEFAYVSSISFTGGKGAETIPGTTQKTAIDCFGFVNESGKYIDASVLANITVVKDNKIVKVSKYNDEKNGVTLFLQDIKPLAQDSNNIYALAEVKVEIEGGASEVKTYLQKISKAQGNKEDDAYVPSKVESFEVSGNYYIDGKNSDLEKAAELIKGDNEFRVVNNTLYVTKVSGSNVEVSTIKLKKQKVTTEKDGSVKYDLYVTELDEQDDQDMQGTSAYSIDAEGNTWALNKGRIYKFNGREFIEVYACDRTMDKLEVYNSDNLMVWEEGEEVFAVIGGKVVNDNEDTTDTEVTTQNGWVKNSNGTWSYYRNNAAVKGQWVQDGNWYYLNAEGVMQTGWLYDRGTWYYLNGSGAMVTGWLNDGGSWYYLQSSGAMKTGWLQLNGTWYYMNQSGVMQTGWVNDNGTWYFMNQSGAMLKNTTVDGYKLGPSGAWIR